MKLLEEKISSEGRIYPGNILKVDSMSEDGTIMFRE